MRAQPPPWREGKPKPALRRTVARQRCPYLEQILKERIALRMLVRYRADCHVDHRTHSFTGRHPAPPCITEPGNCELYRDQWAAESHLIDRYRD